MRIANLIDEDFVNYKKAAMFIAMPYCDFKCNRDCGKNICQNFELAKAPMLDMAVSNIISRYLANPITSAIVFGGLEPFYSGNPEQKFIDHLSDIAEFMFHLRDTCHCNDDVVFYSGYTEDEIKKSGILDWLLPYGHIVIKYGRYIPDHKPHKDEVLGVELASDNQYAMYYA